MQLARPLLLIIFCVIILPKYLRDALENHSRRHEHSSWRILQLHSKPILLSSPFTLVWIHTQFKIRMLSFFDIRSREVHLRSNPVDINIHVQKSSYIIIWRADRNIRWYSLFYGGFILLYFIIWKWSTMSRHSISMFASSDRSCLHWRIHTDRESWDRY